MKMSNWLQNYQQIFMLLVACVFLTINPAWVVAQHHDETGEQEADGLEEKSAQVELAEYENRSIQLAFRFSEVFERLGATSRLVRLFQDGLYQQVIDLAWFHTQVETDEQKLDDLFLLSAEASYRISRRDLAANGHARSSYRFGLNRFPQSPNDPIRFMRLGDLYRDAGFFPEAIAYYEAFLEIAPYDPSAGYIYFGLARTCRQDERWTDALVYYHTAYDLYEDPVAKRDIGLGLACTFFEKGEQANACKVFDQLLLDDASLQHLSDQHLFYYSQSNYSRKEYQKAWNGFVLLDENYPDSPYRVRALYTMGLMKIIQGNPAVATDYFQRVRSFYPESEEYYLSSVRLADLALAKGLIDFEETRAMLLETETQNRFDEPKREALSLLAELSLQEKDYEKAMERLDLILEEVTDNPFAERAFQSMQVAFNGFAEKHFEDGDCLSINETFRKYEGDLLNDRLEGATLNLVGRCQVEKLWLDEADELFSHSVIVKNHKELARFYEAVVATTDQESDDGYQDLATFAVKAKDPNLRARALLMLGDFNRRSGKKKKASSNYRKAIKSGVKEEWSLRLTLRLADMDLDNRKYSSAHARYRQLQKSKCKRKEPGFEENVAFGFMESLYGMKRYKLAQKGFEEFLKNHPEDLRRYLARVRIAKCMVFTGASLDKATEVLTPAPDDDPAYANILISVAEDLTWWDTYKRERK